LQAIAISGHETATAGTEPRTSRHPAQSRYREVSLDPLRWGLIPYWCKDPKGGRKPINAKAETVAGLPIFRDAYARRRCILPVDGFFEGRRLKV
jgi:putative SOS response-associated peptidase YedK